MGARTEILNDILDSLSDEESTMIEKTATDAGSLKNTENKEAAKKLPTETPSKTEKKLGLGALGKNKHEEEVLNFDKVKANGQDGQGTENISPKLPPAEPGTTFEKRASADVLGALYEAAGVDLAKVASEETENDLLVKVAKETLDELADLEKVAEELADKITDRIMHNLENRG